MFTTPGLPALSPDGRLLLFPMQEIDLGGTPNLTLGVLQVAQDSVVFRRVILAAGDFLAAQAGSESADYDRVDSAFAILRSRVAETVRQANASLAREGWSPLPACSVLDKSHEQHPPCSMEMQRILCGEISLSYASQRLKALRGGRKTSLHFPNWARPPEEDPTLGPVPVRECFSRAAFDPVRRLFVGEMIHACQQGGDGCIVQPRWHALVLSR